MDWTLLYVIAREQHPEEILPYKQFFLTRTPPSSARVEGGDQADHQGRTDPRIRRQEPRVPEDAGGRGGAIGSDWRIERYRRSDLALFQPAGQDEFGWRMFADLRDAEWSFVRPDPRRAGSLGRGADQLTATAM